MGINMKDYLKSRRKLTNDFIKAVKDKSLIEIIQDLNILYEENKDNYKGLAYKDLLQSYKIQYAMERVIKSKSYEQRQ